jgi:hypothetical protein
MTFSLLFQAAPAAAFRRGLTGTARPRAHPKGRNEVTERVSACAREADGPCQRRDYRKAAPFGAAVSGKGEA